MDGVDWEWQGGRRSDGQGTFWGDLIGPNPTDRGKAGTSAVSLWMERAALEHSWLREQTCTMPSCWRRPWTPLWSNDHSPPRRNPNTCVWTKGMTILQAVGLPPDTAIGSTSDASARRSWTPLATSGIRRAVGCGTDAGMALQVPCGPGPVRQEGSELPRCVTARMCAPVVPATVASGHFEIVTKRCRRKFMPAQRSL